jgi:hypothetical protein
MTRFLVFVLLTAMTALGTEISSPSTPSDQTSIKTFNKDVLPVLEQNCQVCHRQGGIAPMSFQTYESTRPYAKAIKTAVINKKMPPWFADPHYGEFRNAPKLTEADIKTLAEWADGGAKEGNAADKSSQAPQFKEGWRIDPDVIVSMPQPYRVAANGVGEVREFFVPNPFKEDTWVSAIEIKPGDASVVHHVIVQVPEQQRAVFIRTSAVQGQPSITVCGNCPDGPTTVVPATPEAELRLAQAQKEIVIAQEAALKVQAQLTQQLNNAARGANVVALLDGLNIVGQRGGGGGAGSYSDIIVRNMERQSGHGAFMTMEAVYAPGAPPLDYRYNDSAKLIPGGRPIRIEVHYTPNGKETLDQTQVGFKLAKAPAQRRFVMMAPEHLVDIRKQIPAGDANYETRGELTFNQDADLVWFMPHMHLRGKDMSYKLIYPDGREETVLSTNYNFNWQLGYEVEKPIKVTKGTRMIVTAHHDNSANNPMNPTPNQFVAWGEMTSQEMMLPWFGVVVDGNATPEAIATYKPGDLDGPFPMPPDNSRGVRGGIVTR